MEKAIEVAGTALCSFAPKEPLRVWAIAVRHRLEAEARVAADEMVRQCIVVLDTFPVEMQEICAGAYYRLLRYRRLGGTMIESGFNFCDPPPAQHGRDDVTSAAFILANDPQFISPSHDRIRSLVDVRYRSSDGREFLAHKALLALTSPIMAGMVASIPMSVTATHEAPNANHLPTLVFEEDGATLKIILGLCYPVREGNDTMQELLVVRKVVDAVMKYEMDDAMELFRRQWSQLSVCNPLQAYLLAVHHGSDAEAKTAAQ
ncbi:hypothetical protein DAEQUDRAFT_770313 [Daedalea quercina L-15889]|uniref:BTB domain-containing protein n=1 Tax=Daedalea quercina L-15889 TaxID=1314783 RepID=A0A165KY48_9APHY|nr:hypothetical protein DAEQUDRAFT_770313 [Daedalea quercina L-15889]